MYNAEKDSNNRVIRTFVQLAAGGLFTELLMQVSADVPATFAPYLVILSTLLISVAQNWADELGIPYPGRDGILSRDAEDRLGE